MSERTRRCVRGHGFNVQTGHASRQGASHVKDGTPNQDSAVVRTPSLGRLGPVAIMAVSDGAGFGQILPVWLTGRLRCPGLPAWPVSLTGTEPSPSRGICCGAPCSVRVRSARRSVVDTANRSAGAVNVNDYACTVMLALASERLVGVAHVGDGCVVAGDGDEWSLLSEPDNGEFANETKFLTNPRNLPRIAVTSGSGIRCVAAITDGLQDVALSLGTAPYERFWTPLYRALNRSSASTPDAVLETLLRKVGDAGKATDDCTIAVFIRKG